MCPAEGGARVVRVARGRSRLALSGLASRIGVRLASPALGREEISLEAHTCPVCGQEHSGTFTAPVTNDGEPYTVLRTCPVRQTMYQVRVRPGAPAA